MDLIPGLIEEIEKRFGKFSADLFIVSILGSAFLAFLGFMIDIIIEIETVLNNLPGLLGRVIATIILCLLAWSIIKTMGNRIIKKVDKVIEEGKQDIEKSMQEEKDLLDKIESTQKEQIDAFKEFTAILGDHKMPTPELEAVRNVLKEKFSK